MTILRVTAGAALALAFGPAAWAQDYVRADCRALLNQVAFDDQTHGKWYRRFWNGDCSGLTIFCQAGPDWNGMLDELLQDTPAPRQGAVRDRACVLGQLIGYEWSRDDDVRRIDTRDLRAFRQILDSAPDAETALTMVEAQASAQLAH